MFRYALIVSMLLSSAAFAADAPPAAVPQSGPDMIISGSALKDIETILQDVPMKFSYPILVALQKGIKSMPAQAKPEDEKPK